MLAVVDANMLCHTIKHGIKVELSHNEMRTEIIFGFLRALLFYAKKYKTEDFVFAWDSRKSYRRESYPEYKRNRTAKEDLTDDEWKIHRMVHDQFTEIRKTVLPELGFCNNFIQTGIEADDIIASIVQDYDGEIGILSRDKDLIQLVRSNVTLYADTTYTLDFVKSKFGIDPSQWGEVLAITGCTTDNVQGINGIGIKTAIKYLQGGLNPAHKKYKSIRKNRHLIERNRPLVVLPHAQTKPVVLNLGNQFNYNGYLKICRKYRFNFLLKESSLEQVHRLFGGYRA